MCMKKLLYLLLTVCISFSHSLMADEFINLTPRPKQISVNQGELKLPTSFCISTGDFDETYSLEAQKFAETFMATTGKTVTVQSAETDALIIMKSPTKNVGNEGYQLDITTNRITVRANTPCGFYFAFQSIKKILPPHVMAGVQDTTFSHYALPLVSITDAPRFSYRGFMLDVARHFFTVDEVKRMLDVMSYYKMNRFHWHLTDDQGWRVEIKKYPKLTTVGSIASNCYVTDMKYGPYWTNQQYGPYFYTQEQIKDVVAYAKERHIEIIPEIDMPGHFVAAMTAYPEYSCWPNGGHSVWISGGISSDVLNVANPQAVQFAKDILTEISEMFPYEYVHIGGDECPTSAWEGNALCQARYAELGLTNYRQLQTYFIKEISEHLKSKGKKMAVWNEAITAEGSNTNIIRETGATIFCWQPAAASALQAAQLELNNIFTPWGPYYINRKQSTDPNEPSAAGDGTDNVEKTYNTIPVPSNITATQAKYYTGVQGTFWTEHVADRNYMEYLALPRLIAIAETGWTPQTGKDFEHFRRRMTADSTLLNYNGYNYCRHHMKSTIPDEKVMPIPSTNTQKHWYKIITKATDGTRAGRCWELLSATSPLINTYSGNGATQGVIWTNTQAQEADANFDYQLWSFEQSSTHPDRYAIVCKAEPNGSITPSPTQQSNSGRWKYDANTKHYNFILGDNGYGVNNGIYYYSFRSDKLSGWWLNASMSGQGLAVNLWTDPSSGSGGWWALQPLTVSNDIKNLLIEIEQAKNLASNANTYMEENNKRPGLYAKSKTDALLQLIAQSSPGSMTNEELNTFKTQFAEVFQNFRASFGYAEVGTTYTLTNAVEGFNARIIDSNNGNNLRHTKQTWCDDAWIVVSSTINNDYSQSITLKNTHTGRFIGNSATSSTGQIAYPVTLASSSAQIKCTFNVTEGDFTLSIDNKNLFPVSHTSAALPSIISSGSVIEGSNAVRPMGAAWLITPVRVVTYQCEDEQGNTLGTYRGSLDIAKEISTDFGPEIKNHLLIRVEEIGENQVKAVYRRTAYSVASICRDNHGAIISKTEETMSVGDTYTVTWPEHKYYTFSKAEYPEGSTIHPTSDLTLTATYTTTAYSGVSRLAGAITTKPVGGNSYVLYDTSPNATDRQG